MLACRVDAPQKCCHRGGRTAARSPARASRHTGVLLLFLRLTSPFGRERACSRRSPIIPALSGHSVEKKTGFSLYWNYRRDYDSARTSTSSCAVTLPANEVDGYIGRYCRRTYDSLPIPLQHVSCMRFLETLTYSGQLKAVSSAANTLTIPSDWLKSLVRYPELRCLFLWVFGRVRSRGQTNAVNAMESVMPASKFSLRLHFLITGMVFLGLGSILVVFEKSENTPYYSGHWNGAMAIVSGLTLLIALVKLKQWMILTIVVANSATIIGCLTALLSSLKRGNGRGLPAYWICLCVLLCSVYSVVIVGVSRSTLSRSVTSESFANEPTPLGDEPRQTASPPAGFILPTDVPSLPDYDTLSNPPPYNEAVIANKNDSGHS
uniref:Transmembrane protein n=1 Tax=Mesocestoides corti TaxID=53468 RepID=A0A5K3EJ93_MESCO